MRARRAFKWERAAAWAVALAAVLVPGARAEADLFEVLVTGTGGSPPPDLLVGGSSLPDLINGLINQQGVFAPFAGEEFTASITYAGVADAITVTFDPTAGEATLTFSILGPGAPTFTFGGGDLFGQIESFLQNNLAGQLGAFLEAINALSLVAVTDGTPLSTTARAADFVFDRFALHNDLTAAEKRAAGEEPRPSGWQMRVDGYYEQIETDVGDGTSYAIAPSFELVFTDHVALALMFPVSYHEIEGSEVVNIHANAALPITVLHPEPGLPVGLRVTPFVTFAAAGSVDMVAGSLLTGGGVNGVAQFELGDLTVSLAGQFTFYESLTLRYQDYEFDPGISQQILKGGIKLTHTLGDDWYVYGSVTETMFVDQAAIGDYLSPGAGIGYRDRTGANFSLGYRGDIASGYDSHQLRMTLQFAF
ncbi:MAG: hypothetical protein ACYSXF_04470 [Planctomycetota bacterium]